MNAPTSKLEAVIEAVRRAEQATDMQATAYPEWGADAVRWALALDGAEDGADLFMAAHCIMVLGKIAADRESLHLLKLWLSPRRGGYTVAQLVALTFAWARAARENRQVVLSVLGELADDVQREAAGRSDESEVLNELEEVRAEIEALKEDRMQADLSLFDCFERPTPSMRAFARAVASYRKLYPLRMVPLGNLAAVAAARSSIAKRVQR